jgi:hypothetical protein
MDEEVWCRGGSQTAIFLINLFLCQGEFELHERGFGLVWDRQANGTDAAEQEAQFSSRPI